MRSENKNKITIPYWLSFVTIFIFLFSQYITKGILGEISQNMEQLQIKYIFLLFTCVINIISMIKNNKKLFENGHFKFEFDNYFIAIFSIIIITLIFQILNGFKDYTLSEILYLITPLLFVVIVISLDYYNISRLINTLFYSLIVIFIFQNFSELSIQSILSVDFFNSYSPFESGISPFMIVFVLFFLVNRCKLKAIMCAIIAYLTLKRIAVLICVSLIVFWPIVEIKMDKKKITSILKKITIVFFIFLPFVMQFFYSDKMAIILHDNYKININELTMDRYRRTKIVLDNKDSIKYGLGSTTEFITYNIHQNHFLENRNLHCDILRLYLECTIVGTIIVTYFYFKSTKNNIFSYILMTNIFIDMIFNHNFLGAGNVGFWCVIYLVIFYLNNYKEMDFYKIKKKGD